MRNDFDVIFGLDAERPLPIRSRVATVRAKPLPSPRSLIHGQSFLVSGFGGPQLRQSFLFPLSPGLTLPIASSFKRHNLSDGGRSSGSSGTSAKTAKRRNSAYASWAKDPENPRRYSSWSGKLASADCDLEESAATPAEAEGSSVGCDEAICQPSPSTLTSEPSDQRLSRERSEMLEAARRRDAEEKQRRAEKDAWQVAALAERRREAMERRRNEAEQRRREAEAQRRREEVEACRRREKRAAVIAQRHSEEGRPACASDLHGDVLFLVLRFLDAHTLLLSVMGVRELWHSAAKDDELWLPLCRERWSTKVRRFHLTEEKQAMLTSDPFGPPSWFDAYREAEEDGAREFIFRDELTQLTFQFHWRRFTGQVASRNFRFAEDNLTIGHPFNARFPWVLDDLGVGIQWGPAEDMFPKGFVSRLADWSWRIENVNGVLVEVEHAEQHGVDPVGPI